MSMGQLLEQQEQEWFALHEGSAHCIAQASVRLMEQGRLQAGLELVRVFADPKDRQGIGDDVRGQALRVILFMNMLQQVRDRGAFNAGEVQDLEAVAQWMRPELFNALSLHRKLSQGQLGRHSTSEWVGRVPAWPDMCALLARDESRWMGAAFATCGRDLQLRGAIKDELQTLIESTHPRQTMPTRFRRELGRLFVSDPALGEAVQLIDPDLARVSPEAFLVALQSVAQQASAGKIDPVQQVRLAQHALCGLAMARLQVATVMNIRHRELLEEAHGVVQTGALGAIEQLAQANPAQFWESAFWHARLGDVGLTPPKKSSGEEGAFETPLDWVRKSAWGGEDFSNDDQACWSRWWMQHAPPEWTRVHTWSQLTAVSAVKSTRMQNGGGAIARAALALNVFDWAALRQPVAQNPLMVAAFCVRAYSEQAASPNGPNRIWTTIGLTLLDSIELAPVGESRNEHQMAQTLLAMCRCLPMEFEAFWPVLDRALELIASQNAEDWPLPSVKTFDACVSAGSAIAAASRGHVPLVRARLEACELGRTLSAGQSMSGRRPSLRL